MRLLIDGYNLLHATKWLDAEGDDQTPPNIPAAEQDLLARLAKELSGTSLRATVVFDAAPDTPFWVPMRSTIHGIEVVRAVDRATADEMLVEMIEKDTGPRDLVVVSTDHMVRDAARKRGATCVRSEEFWTWLAATARTQAIAADKAADKPEYITPQEVRSTVNQFEQHRAISPKTDPRARRPRRPRLVIRKRRTRRLR